MKCKSCGREIEDNSLFCNWCGEKQLKERKKKDALKVPSPRKLASGNWRIYLDAEKQSITEPTKELCIAKAKAIRAGFIEKKKNASRITLGKAIDKMIAERGPSLSPSTRRNYMSYRKNHFLDYMGRDLSGITKSEWQIAIGEELKHCSPKTVCNVWALVTATMNYLEFDVPNVTLPAFKKGGQPTLDYEQILVFVKAIREKPIELGALLALHSLRRSEIMALTRDSLHFEIKGSEYLSVSGAVVYDENGKLVHKDTNKSEKSTRPVPVLVPRLLEVIPDEGPLIDCYPNTLTRRINAICIENNLPQVGVHGLRRSFCSLAYHLGWSEERTMRVGGWNDIKVVHECYLREAAKDKNAATNKMRRFYLQGSTETTQEKKSGTKSPSKSARKSAR